MAQYNLTGAAPSTFKMPATSDLTGISTTPVQNPASTGQYSPTAQPKAPAPPPAASIPQAPAPKAAPQSMTWQQYQAGQQQPQAVTQPQAQTVPQAVTQPQAQTIPQATTQPQAQDLSGLMQSLQGLYPQFNSQPTAQTMQGLPPGVVGVSEASGYQTQPGYQPSNLQDALGQGIGLQGGIQGIVNSGQSSQNLNNYVDQATQGLTANFKQQMANQVAALQSQYAGEGSYLSSPMFAAQGQLQANLTGDYLNSLGQLQLGAAEAERGRQYTAAQQQSQNALGLSTLFEQLAAQAQASGSTLQAAQWNNMADVYKTQANYLASTYGSQTGANASMYGSNAGAAASMYGSQNNLLGNLYGSDVSKYLGELNNQTQNNQIDTNGLLSLLGLGLQGQQQQFNQQNTLSQNDYNNQLTALLALLQQYNAPGQNALSILQPFLNLQNASKSSSSSGLGGLF